MPDFGVDRVISGVITELTPDGRDGGVLSEPGVGTVRVGGESSIWRPFHDHASKRTGALWVENEIADLVEDLNAIADSAEFSMLAGHQAMGELAVKLADEAAPIGPRGEDRSSESQAHGPLSESTRFEATAEYVDIIGPAYGRLVAEGANNASPNPYIDRAVSDNSEALQQAFIDSYMLAARSRGYDPSEQGISVRQRLNRIGQAGAVDVSAYAAAFVASFYGGRMAYRSYKASEKRRIALTTTLGSFRGLVASTAITSYKLRKPIAFVGRSTRSVARGVQATNRALVRARQKAMAAARRGAQREATKDPNKIAAFWEQTWGRATVASVEYARGLAPVAVAVAPVIAGQYWWRATKAARDISRKAAYNAANRRIGARFRFGKSSKFTFVHQWGLTGDRAGKARSGVAGSAFGGAFMVRQGQALQAMFVQQVGRLTMAARTTPDGKWAAWARRGKAKIAYEKGRFSGRYGRWGTSDAADLPRKAELARGLKEVSDQAREGAMWQERIRSWQNLRGDAAMFYKAAGKDKYLREYTRTRRVDIWKARVFGSSRVGPGLAAYHDGIVDRWHPQIAAQNKAIRAAKSATTAKTATTATSFTGARGLKQVPGPPG